MFWFMQGLCFLPVFLVIWSSSTFVTSYLIAIFRKDVDLIFPYISDTGANPPESCIFGLMTFISACAGAATMYARYKFVEKLNEGARVVRPCLNKSALVLGMLSCFSMCIVATFQETTITKVHDAGALLFFVSGVLYIIIQSVISYPFGSSTGVFRARVVISIIAALAFFPTVICAFFVKQTTLHRDKGDQDYPFHVASAVCEWVVAFSFVCFFLTYIDDFKLFTLRVHTEFEDLS
ncbi:DNA damage-regulated autophagy modulator protein 1 [Trachinotus anak]|uniref:DNA damage-regulated autophagy modulator protein 1 n=1 Tax=Trachinotus anak TaxID=443729 RepID=UPI0039F22829